ncbi:MAG: helix-turn-helix domain-containing protein [Chthoniobacterales bacterium]
MLFGARSESRFSPTYRSENDKRGDHPFVILQYTLSGRGRFEWEGRVWNVTPGKALISIVPERSTYYFPNDATEPWRFAWVNFYGTLAISLCRALRRQYGPVLELPQRSIAAAAFLELTAKAEKRLILDPCDTTLSGFTFLMEWKRQLDKPRVQDIDPVKMVIRICQARFREPLGVKELADQVGLSREHLTRIFKEHTGDSPACYLRTLRVKAARKMLRHSGITLKEVALRCGFPSAKAMKRILKSGT